MTPDRQVPFSALWNAFKAKAPHSIVGLILTLLALIVLLPVSVYISSSLTEPHEDYDFDAIREKGRTVKADLIRTIEMGNVSVNGQHPQLLRYKYVLNGVSEIDQSTTLDLDIVKDFKVGDKVDILVYNGESMLKDAEPFSFPKFIFFMIPAPFLLVGIIFLGIGLVPALKKFKLYRHGALKEATITSLTVMPGRPRGGKAYLLITYFFTGNSGQKVAGQSTTPDLSLLSFKKEGDTIKVFADMQNNEVSTVAPEKEFWMQSAR